jgi:hypothetical protein
VGAPLCLLCRFDPKLSPPPPAPTHSPHRSCCGSTWSQTGCPPQPSGSTSRMGTSCGGAPAGPQRA